jgi:argininosuccinate lyase
VAAATIREAMDPAAMVRNRKGLGGPQPAEVERMLESQRAALAAQRAWLEATRSGLEDATVRLDAQFGKLARGG